MKKSLLPDVQRDSDLVHIRCNLCHGTPRTLHTCLQMGISTFKFLTKTEAFL